eukprot:GILJ01007850.1.p1 GENE.GILJ01007850.1~~GILJ01007850.1.p1  ORF type:complete len:558 (-),score=49.05 GILJ01007850.1:103-1713(-)
MSPSGRVKNDTEDEHTSLVMHTTAQSAPSCNAELRAWYSYDWASSVFPALGIALFIPLFMLELTRQAAGCGDDRDPCDKFLSVGPFKLRPASVFLNSLSLSVFVQTITFITAGALADYGILRNTLLSFFAVIGSVACMCFVFVVSPDSWWVAALLLLVSNVSSGLCSVFYNSFLPLLVRFHPKLQQFRASNSSTFKDPTTQLENDTQYARVHEQMSDHISKTGSTAGFSASFILLVASVVLISLDSSMDGLRTVLFLTGLWWCVFSRWSAWRLKRRPGPPLPQGKRYLSIGWVKAYRTFAEAKQLPNTMKYLLSYFLFSDAISTLSHVAIVFGVEELKMTTQGLILLAVEVPLLAVVGNFLFVHLQNKWGVRPITMLKRHLWFLSLIPCYAFMGLFLPFGLVYPFEIYILGLIYGLNLGSSLSYARTVYADLIPHGHEAQFFSLYAITDRGSSWIGPLICSVIFDLTNSMRMGMSFLLFSFFAAIWLLNRVDVEEGRLHAQAYTVVEVERSNAVNVVELSLSQSRTWLAENSRSTQ